MKNNNSKLRITETVLRDAHQSLIATRMTTDEMLPALDALDRAGYYSLECWGGATFDVCIRYLNEDPWARLRTIRDRVKNTRLQMLLRGQNLLGYRHYADDVVQYFVQKSIANGVDVLRIFDALNDTRNIKAAADAAIREGGTVQLAMAYTTGEAYTLDYWRDLARRMEDMGAESICIKDMAGLLTPSKTTELVTMLKENVSIPIQFHSHCTSGIAPISYVRAVEAGVDGLDTAVSPFSMGTSQPATEVMMETFKGTEYDTGLNEEAVTEAADYFRKLRAEKLANGQLNPKVLETNVKTLTYQIPGGMLSNLLSQLKEQHAEDRLDEIMAEIPKVRKDLGEPPLVTPSCQIVGTQSVLNVLMNERYAVIPNATKAMLHGDYGRPMMDFDKEVQKKAIGDEKPVTVRPADLIAPEMETLRKEAADFAECDEDILTYAMFPEVAKEFFKRRDQGGLK